MNIIHLEETGSTNDYAKKHISDLDNLTVIYADRQTNGRGRLERKWIDTGEENVYMSIVLKPFEEPNPIYPNFTQYLSVILAMYLEEEYSLKTQIQWPNDVLINGKKIAGILAEATSQGGCFQGLVLGLGVNLNTTPETLVTIDKPATSFYNETGRRINI